MSITDELREYFGKSKGMFTDHVLAIADRIDAEHERGMADAELSAAPTEAQLSELGYVELPKDADDEEIIEQFAATLGRSNVVRYVGLRQGEYWERTENSNYYCGGCGWKVTDHDSYCPECGGSLHKTTLGTVTCEQEEGGWSTEGDHARVWLTCGHDCMVETVADLPNFCPVCGAKVVEPTTNDVDAEVGA